MIRRLLALLLLAACAGPVCADEPASSADTPRIAWFQEMAAARTVATQTGRPLFIALHVRPNVASPEATRRLERWSAVYADPEIVALSRQCACVLRVIQAPEGKDPDTDRGQAAVHMLVDGTSRLLARLDADEPKDGVARTQVDLAGISPSKPVGVPLGVPGVRLRLRWELPAPTLQGAQQDRVKAQVRMRWDGEGPFDVGRGEFWSGAEIDTPIDVRFDAFEGLAPLATKGKHRVDLYLDPLPGSYPFSQGALHVGRVGVDLGEGGGGDGSSSDSEEEKPDEPPPSKPQPVPDEGQEELPQPPTPQREEVVQPFVNEGETVEKDDAVVAVEDPEGGVKPPKQVPLEQALRDFEKVKEREVTREGIAAGERTFLRRYFDLLERAVKAAAKK